MYVGSGAVVGVVAGSGVFVGAGVLVGTGTAVAVGTGASVGADASVGAVVSVAARVGRTVVVDWLPQATANVARGRARITNMRRAEWANIDRYCTREPSCRSGASATCHSRLNPAANFATGHG